MPPTTQPLKWLNTHAGRCAAKHTHHSTHDISADADGPMYEADTSLLACIVHGSQAATISHKAAHAPPGRRSPSALMWCALGCPVRREYGGRPSAPRWKDVLPQQKKNKTHNQGRSESTPVWKWRLRQRRSGNNNNNNNSNSPRTDACCTNLHVGRHPVFLTPLRAHLQRTTCAQDAQGSFPRIHSIVRVPEEIVASSMGGQSRVPGPGLD